MGIKDRRRLSATRTLSAGAHGADKQRRSVALLQTIEFLRFPVMLRMGIKDRRRSSATRTLSAAVHGADKQRRSLTDFPYKLLASHCKGQRALDLLNNQFGNEQNELGCPGAVFKKNEPEQ